MNPALTELLPLLDLYADAGRTDTAEEFLGSVCRKVLGLTGSAECFMLFLGDGVRHLGASRRPGSDNPVSACVLEIWARMAGIETAYPFELEEMRANLCAELRLESGRQQWPELDVLELNVGDDLVGLVGCADPRVPLGEDAGQLLSTALGNFYIFGQARRHLARQSFLREVGWVFSSGDSLREKMRNFLVRLNVLKGVDGASLFLLDPTTGEQRPTVEVDLAPPEQAQIGSLVGQVVSRGAPLHVPELPGGGSYLGIPLVRREMIIGVLNIYCAQPDAYTRRDVEFFTSVSERIGLNVDNARLLEQTQQQVEELSFVFWLSAVLRREKSVGGIMETVLRECVRTTGGDQGYLLFEDEDTLLAPAASWGQEGSLPAVPVSLCGDGYDYTEMLGRMRYCDHPRSEFPELFARPPLDDLPAHLKGWILIPLRTSHKGLLGAMLVGKAEEQEVQESERRLLLTLTNVAENAIGRAMAFEEMQARVREESASRAKSEFLAIMSHELRTPLTAILGFTEVILAERFGSLQPKYREYMTDILHNSKHLLELINDVLDLAKVEAGKVELAPENLNLEGVLADVESSLSSLAQRKGLDLVLPRSQEFPCLAADRRRLKQVLFNLVSNAIKFTDAPGKVELRVSRDDGQVVIAVQDTGIGIAREDQERIFWPFSQVGTPGRQAQEGTGLGLSLTRKLVELHGGHISLKSAPGQGSTFYVELPGGEA